MWINLKKYLEDTFDMEVKNVDGNGYCFLNAVVKVLEKDYGEIVTVEHAIEQIMKYVCTNYDRYTKYHAQGKKDMEPTIADTLISDMIDFFSSRNFNTNIVDLLIQITADVLQLELYIYQNNGGQIQTFRFTGCKAPTKVVRLKFIHDDLHPQGNHYEAIIKKKKKTTQQPPFYSEVLRCKEDGKFKKPNTFEIKKEPQMNLEKDQMFIDLTDKDNDYVPPPPPCRRRRLSGGNSSSTEWSDETYISSDSENIFNTQSSLLSHFKTSRYSKKSTSTSTPASLSSENEWPSFPTPSTSSTSVSSDNEGHNHESKLHETIEAQALAENISRGKPFPLWYFDNKIPQHVPYIPQDINGTCYFEIPVVDHRWHGVTSDRRHFKMVTTSRSGYRGEVRLGFCRGSFVCTNEKCPFKKTSHLHQPNKVSWRNIRGVREYKICAICDETAERIECGARKFVHYDYNTHTAKVYHIGQHTCWPQVTQQSTKIIEHLNKFGRQKGSAKDVGIEEIVNLIDAGDMSSAAKEAEVWVDRRKIKRTMEAMKPTAGQDENSFDAVGILKKKTDEMDKYYIYQIGNVNCGHECDYVFKSSRKMAQIAIDMDIDGEENLLQLENAYFDATHSRVQYFKSLGLWLIHPAMKKILRLASMDIRSEHHRDIALFLTLFNKILAEVKGDPNYKFNPRYFVCDESGANYKALGLVYGEQFTSIRAKGCQWHFKQDVQKHTKNVAPNDQQRFIETCFNMCDTTTVADYERLEITLNEIAEDNPEIRPFVMFWEPRKSHVFKPYRGGGLPGVNMSEQANKTFKPTVSPQAMRLVHAAKYDTATMMYQEKEIEMFQRNLVKASGRGLSAGARAAKERAEQMKVAADFVMILDNEDDVMMEAEEAINPSTYIPNAKDKHAAPRKKKYKRRCFWPRKRKRKRGL